MRWLLFVTALVGVVPAESLSLTSPSTSAAAPINKNTYVIIAPNKVRAGSTFTISVNILRASNDVSVKATITMGKVEIGSASALFDQGKPGELNIKIPSDQQHRGSPILMVKGTGGLQFEESRSVGYDSKPLSLFIQTDKAMYKPGDTVNFRVLTIYPDLKPYNGPVTVAISDASSNKIRVYNSLTTQEGVLTNLISLSSQPVLGDWKITANVSDVYQTKEFTIDEYVLPKFEVDVLMPSYVVASDRDVTFTVKAKYTYGQPVKGSLDLAIKLHYSYQDYDNAKDPPVFAVNKANIDGETKITMPMSDALAVSKYLSGRKLSVRANITESLTGNTLSGSGTVSIYSTGSKIEFPASNPNTFKPGLQYIAYIKVSQQDGLPVAVSKTPVTVSVRVTSLVDPKATQPPNQWWWSPQTTSTTQPDKNFTVPVNGLVAIPIDVPATAKDIYINAKYDKASTGKSIVKSYSPSDSYMQLSLKSGSKIQAGDTISFGMKATQPLGLVIYQVLSRGSMVDIGSADGQGYKTMTFSLSSTSEMAPNAKLVVYYVRKDGEIVTDSISFDIEGVFKNKVAISINQTEAEPGEPVKVTVTADPNSHAHLLAVDQSVLLLKSGNDITADDVYTELKSYDTSVNPGHGGPIFGGGAGGPFGRDIAMARRKRSIWFPYPIYYGGSDAKAIFRNAGVVVFTNALVFEHVEPIPNYPVRFPEAAFGAGGGDASGVGGGGGAAPPPNAPNASGGSAMKKPSRTRSNFPERPHPEIFNKIHTFDLLDKITSNIGGVIKPEITGGSKKPDSLKEPAKVRKLFPETWLWTSELTNSNGKAELTTKVPDTITSWVATAFAVNSVSGLGVAPTAAEFKVFRPFFVSLNLPYSVVRGEHVAIQAIVFNYMTTDQQVTVTLSQSKEFNNIKVDAYGNEAMSSGVATQNVVVKTGQAKSVYFPIVPAVLGKINIEVKAQSYQAADALRRQLLVEPEGVSKEYNVPVLINLENNGHFTKYVNLTMPANTVSDSELVKVSAIGDIMGPSISGIDNLLRMPTGCGEQTMLGLAPDVYVTDYLTSTNQLTGDIKDKALGYMEKGYQRELTYKHKDGSFSAFGESDKSGSMWLTAFVCKVFHQAKPYIYVDDNVIKTAISWMINHQSSNGSFSEPGRVIHKNMQGNAGSGVSLTTFVVISFLENRDLFLDTTYTTTRFNNSLTKALNYLNTEVSKSRDPYLMAMASYAFQLSGNDKNNQLLVDLDKMAIHDGGLWHLHQPESKKATKGSWHSPNPTSAVDTEMTSYVLMTYALRRDIGFGRKIMQWVTQQRNSNGGFSSTQDTVVALNGLSMMAKQLFSNNFNLDVKVTLDSSPMYSFHIDSSNAAIMQRRETTTVPAKVKIDAMGAGSALIEIAVFFNVEKEVEDTTFDLQVMLLEETKSRLKVRTCANWLGDGEASGMAVQEIGIPSGFQAVMDSFTELPTLKRKETQDKKVILYFDEIGTSSVCLTFVAERVGMVSKSQPASIRVYDYYEPGNQVTGFYQSQLLKNTNICDVCTECENCVQRKG